jgi:transglutaminase-like putative cysteine protease
LEEVVIDKPVEGVKTDARPHPPGGKGAKISLDEVAERAWKARMSPRLRAWVTRVLDAAKVSSGTRKQKGHAILEAFRKKVPYVADPVMGEFMATPEQTLCLDEGGLCFVGGDCDDHSIGLAAAMMSIGINAMIVGASYREPGDVPTHVYMAFEDEDGNWIYMDGTTKHPVGKVAPRLREFWVEPGEKAKANGSGDFVGMSGAPGTLAGAPTTSTMLDLLYPGIR